MTKKVRNSTRKTDTKSRARLAGYRSGLEDDISLDLKQKGIAADYEPFKIPWTLPATKRRYTPDFVLPNGIVIESKGRFVTEDRQKHVHLKKQYPDLDIRFVFQRSATKLRKGAKSTYADWCEKHGFMYADKLIPEAWLNEPNNLKSINQTKEFMNV